ncbi:MAG: DoxX family protein [Verrucomicrobia bacterium]|nr:DoxX family protein [Verrucomicrobiota bacterium]
METNPAPLPKWQRWLAYILCVPPVGLLLFSAAMKIVQAPGVADGFTKLGLPLARVGFIGWLEFGCTIVFLIPRTAVLGAVLLTGYLGGATLTHLRVGEPFFMPPLLGALLWVNLYLRDPRIRALLPWRR